MASLELQRFERCSKNDRGKLCATLIRQGAEMPMLPRRRPPRLLTNFARNSPTATSNLEMASLELQRFERCSKNDRGKLCATFIRQGAAIPLWPRSGPAVARRPGRRPRNPPESRHCLVQVSPHSSFGPAVRGKYLGHNGNGGRPPTPARSVLTPGRRRGLAA